MDLTDSIVVFFFSVHPDILAFGLRSHAGGRVQISGMERSGRLGSDLVIGSVYPTIRNLQIHDQ